MTNRPIRDERILEAIEACRPGSDDAADPALAYLAAALAADPELENLYGRLQQVDGMLAAGFHNVPVPEGLKHRLLERLAAARAGQAASAEEGHTAEASAEEPATQVSPRSKRVSRRWLLAGGGALTAAVALLISAWIGMNPSEPPDRQAVLDEAVRFFAAEPSEAVFVEEEPPLDKYPVGRAVVGVSRIRWRPIDEFLERRGVAYDLSRGGVRATLYVVEHPVDDVLAVPPTGPQPTTGGCSAAAWLEGGLMYVLVVEHRNPQVFGRFLVPRTWT